MHGAATVEHHLNRGHARALRLERGRAREIGLRAVEILVVEVQRGEPDERIEVVRIGMQSGFVGRRRAREIAGDFEGVGFEMAEDMAHGVV